MANILLHRNAPPQTVGFDVDNVIVQSFGALQEYIRQNNIYFTDDDYKALSLGVRSNHEVPEGIVSSERVDDFMDNHYVKFSDNLELMPGIVEAMAYIRKLGHTATIITARGDNVYPNAEASTKSYLDRKKISYDNILFNSHNKATACLENGIEILVDDSLSTCIKASQAGIRAVLFASDLYKDSGFEPMLNNWLDLDKVQGILLGA
jgi:uncharacterized HAD superfamily protein